MLVLAFLRNISCFKIFPQAAKKEGLSELALVFLFWELLKKQTRKLDGYE